MRDCGVVFRRALLLGVCLIVAPTMAAAAWCEIPDSPPPDLVRTLQRELEPKLGARPNPLPRLHTEGTLPGQGIYDESVAAKKDFGLMRTYAIAWRLTGDSRYRDRADAYLRAWATTYKPSFNPIDETGFDAVIDTYMIARDGLTPETQTAMEDFLRRLATGYVRTYQTQYDRRKSSWINNWQSHRIKLVTLSAVALNDASLFAQARQMFQQQVDVNLRADGTVLDFELRDALHYVVYNLEPLTRAAMAAHANGENWLRHTGTHGASLADAIDWLIPYAVGAKVHEEFVRSTVKFDATRRNAGVKGFGGQFDPQKSRPLFWMASTLEPKYLEVAKKLGKAPTELVACRRVG
jgi:hypothetical protein